MLWGLSQGELFWYNARIMNKSLFYIVVVAALGGFLFGFDSGVISGCEKAIQGEFALSAFWHGLIISGALIGTVIGVFTAGRPSDPLADGHTLPRVRRWLCVHAA